MIRASWQEAYEDVSYLTLFVVLFGPSDEGGLVPAIFIEFSSLVDKGDLRLMAWRGIMLL